MGAERRKAGRRRKRRRKISVSRKRKEERKHRRAEKSGRRKKQGGERGRGRGWTEVGTSKEESLKREVVVSAKNTAIYLVALTLTRVVGGHDGLQWAWGMLGRRKQPTLPWS